MDDRISAQLAEAHNSLRVELAAAQRHFERLEQILAARESKDIASLNHSVRRLRSAGNREAWSDILVEATQGFCGRAALFTLRGKSLHLEAERNAGGAIPDVPLDLAPAFRSAVESRDTVVAMRTSGEMSAPIAASLGEAAQDRFYLFPVTASGRLMALLYADAEGAVQSEALELLASVAGALVENRQGGASEALPGLVNIAEAIGSPEDQDLHLRAQRFARVQVADMRLYKSEDVKSGRAEGDLYGLLKAEIDSAREIYRRDFLAANGGLVDYLHLELVHTLANGEEGLLGPDYPGPMVGR